MKRATLVVIISLCLNAILFASTKPSVPDSAHLQLMLRKLSVVGGVLYVAAHPDDENTAVLAAMSQGKLVRTGYLSMTRGDGGQNLIGAEQGPLLGLIRTQELLAARDIDRAQQFFTRAVDFGYTKSPDETLNFWGRENILSDVVWVIRKFRPDVILLRFPATGGGHGQHTASAILAQEAFTAAADPARFPEQLKSVKPWQAKRLLWNYYNWGTPPTDADKAAMVPFEAGSYNPLLGYSYTEIAGISRSMHKSQGFGDSEDRGAFLNYFKLVAGEPAKSDLFEGVDLTWNRIAGAGAVQKTLADANAKFQPEDPSAILPLLLKAKTQMDALPSNPWVEEKKAELLEVIRGCAGLWLEAIATEDTGVPGGTLKVVATAINRSNAALQLESVQLNPSGAVESVKTTLANNQPLAKEIQFQIPANIPFSQQYWLSEEAGKRIAHVEDPQQIGSPEAPAPLSARFTVVAGNERMAFDVPVLSRRVDPVRGEIYRRFEIIPQVAVNLKDPVLVFSSQETKQVPVILRAGAPAMAGTVHLKAPSGWTITPAEIPFDLKAKGDLQTVQFSVAPVNGATSGSFTAEAVVGDRKISSGIQIIDYPHIPVQTVFPKAEGKLVRVDLKKNGQNIGYIVGSGDGIPDALRQVGYKVTLLSDEDLMTGNLAAYDTVIAGIRAYNTRNVLRAAQSRLLEYVKNGGTLLVQYNTTQELMEQNIGPYPLKVSRDRVSVEDAPVTMVDPAHPLLNQPNKITAADFDGWIQERGVNFPGEWDPQYQTVIASNDPGEPSKPGGMLYARYGKGVYIYSAYSWFRELPAGVPGAYRLFVNLISAK